MADEDVSDPGIPDFAGDYDGFAADAVELDRFPAKRLVQAGGRRVTPPVDRAA